MINLLYAEFDKLKKSKSFWGCAIAIVCMVLAVYAIFKVAEKIQSGEMENGAFNVVVTQENAPEGTGDASGFEEIGVLDIAQQMFAGDFMSIIIAIFCGIFVAGEYAHGTFKNFVGKGYSRSTVYLSRLVAAIAAVEVMILFGAVINLCCGVIFRGTGEFTRTFWGNFAAYIGLQMVIASALTAVFVLTTECCRNLGGSISIGIGIALFSMLLTTGLDLLFYRTDFKPSEYWLMDMSVGCPLSGFEAGYVVKTLLTSAVWLAAAAGAGIWHFCRTDIK